MFSINRRAEEIFESDSDACEKLSSVGPRVPVTKSNESKQYLERHPPNPDLIKTSINVDKSFEVFAGKVYYPNIGDEYASMGISQDIKLETPGQRLQRLRQELLSLKSELETLDSREQHSEAAFWSTLKAEANNLLNTADDLFNHNGLKILESKHNTSTSKLKEFLNDIVHERNGGVSGQTVVIEKHNQPQQLPSQLSTESSPEYVLALEKRIFSLETVLGCLSNTLEMEAVSNGTGKNAFPLSSMMASVPLMEAMARLEQRVALLDSDSLDTLKAKASALKFELESANKSRSSVAESRALEAFKKVDDLYSMTQKVESVAEELPTLVLRLKILEEIHLSANQFANRLQDIETSVDTIAADVKGNNEVLTTLQRGLIENLAAMEKNIISVDKRIEGLNK